jgi:hypothetical protein
MRLLRRNGVLAGLCLLLAAASCSESASPGGEDDAALYSVVIRRVAAGEAAQLPEMVFIETLPGTDISLAEQTSILKALDDVTEVRFIDDQDEAIDDAEPGAPVRHAGVLVRVGTAERDDGDAEVKAVRYVDEGHEQSVCVQAHLTGGEWQAVSADAC